MNLREKLVRAVEIVEDEPEHAATVNEILDEHWQYKRAIAGRNPPGCSQRSRAINEASAVRATQQRIEGKVKK